MPEAVTVVQKWVERGERHYVSYATVHGVMECQRDKSLLHIYHDSGLTLPDGMPVVWAGWLQGFQYLNRVYSPDFMLEIIKISSEKGYSHFFYGGNIGVAKELTRRLAQKYRGLNTVGTYTPPFRPLNHEEEMRLIEQVAMAKPDFFGVGPGTPKQERFMADNLFKLDTKVMLGVGAAFDIHAGRTRDAPQWMKRTGLHWLHRLVKEPRRLWKKYLINNPIFIVKLILQLITRNRNFQKGQLKMGKL